MTKLVADRLACVSRFSALVSGLREEEAQPAREVFSDLVITAP